MRKIIAVFVFGVVFLCAGGVHAQTIQVPSAPTGIFIPKIGTETSIVPVDVTATNNLGVPPNFVQAGWYDRSAVPGTSGTAIIDGHVDNGGAINGVFKNLHTLTVGDDVYAMASDGSLAHYKVTNLAVYSTAAFPSQQIFATTGKSLLKIITCYGTFLPKQGTYNDRLVVTATLVS